MWVQLIVMLVMMVVSYLLTPKPKVQNAVAGTLSGVASIENTQKLPVLFGTREMMTPNVVWYGDLRLDPIKSGGKGKK